VVHRSSLHSLPNYQGWFRRSLSSSITPVNHCIAPHQPLHLQASKRTIPDLSNIITYVTISRHYHTLTHQPPHKTTKMCYKVVERYSVCKCVYFQHSIDPCSAYGQRGHSVQEKTVLVGYACPRHSARGASSSPDSGYSSYKGSYR